MLEPNPGHWAEIVKDKKPLERMAGTVCHLPISVGRSYYEDGAFKDILYAISRTFGFCKIHIADTLQARTLCITRPKQVFQKAQELNEKQNGQEWAVLDCAQQNELLQKAAWNMANEKGKLWVQRNRPLLEEILPNRYTIDYWNDWTDQSEFKVYQETVEAQYNSSEDARFRDAINLAAANFIGVLHNECRKRQQAQKKPVEQKLSDKEGANSFDPTEASIKNKEYIKEETAVVKMWQMHHALNQRDKETTDKKRFIVIYPNNTPAHRCMTDCLNVLSLPDELFSGCAVNQQEKISTANILSEIEFFDIAFYCTKTCKNSKDIFQRDLYSVVSHRRKPSGGQDRKGDNKRHDMNQTKEKRQVQPTSDAVVMSKVGVFQPVESPPTNEQYVHDRETPIPNDFRILNVVLDEVLKSASEKNGEEEGRKIVVEFVEKKLNGGNGKVLHSSDLKCIP